jgi:hypothetical protein
MNRPIHRALTAVVAIISLAGTGLAASACAAHHNVRKTITIPSPDQVSDVVYHADQCPWLKLLAESPVPVTADGHPIQGPRVVAGYSMLIASPLCATESSTVGN